MPQIVPYTPSHEPALLDLERASPQGKRIQLEMIRERLIDRSIVFEDYQLYVIEGDGGQPVGMAGVAATEAEHNGGLIPVGLCYDLRVGPEYRGQGLANEMGRHVIRDFFHPRGLRRYLLTMKTTNTAVLRSVQSVLGLAHTYPFQYLTLPATRRVKHRRVQPSAEARFGVIASDPDRLPDGWYHPIEPEMGTFDTHRMYQIKVVGVARHMRWLIRIAELLRDESNTMPREDEVMKFAALCYSGIPDADSVNRALATLEARDVQYLTVCCQRRDPVYRLLRPRAINALDYLIVSNFQIGAKDRFRIDVRCL